MYEKDLVNPAYLEYAAEYSLQEDPLLERMQRETYLEELSPIMISTPLQGKFFYMLTKMLKPQRVLEIGTFTGFSAICMARGLEADALLHTIEFKKELEPKIRGYIREAGLEERIDLRIGNALEVIKELEGPFDMVFIDADKPNYKNYYDAVFPKMSTGGIIIADNVLWSGKVFSEDNEPSTKALRAYNKMVMEDDRVEQILLPLGDGLNIARKII